MPTYDLAGLVAEARQWVLETPGSPGGDNPLLWKSLAVRATDTVARDSKCFWGPRSTNIVSGQQEYCLPGGMVKFQALSMLSPDTTPEWSPLDWVGLRRADHAWAGRWRAMGGASASPPTGRPTCAIIASLSAPIWLYPVPDHNVTAGLRFEGYIVPGNIWEFDGSLLPLPITAASVNPLPDWSQGAIPLKMASFRCIQYPTKENMIRKVEIDAEYKTIYKQVEALSADMAALRRASRRWQTWR